MLIHKKASNESITLQKKNVLTMILLEKKTMKFLI
jgi:hypothetical protein